MQKTTKELCKQLFDEGVASANSGDKETAVARFDEVIARCTPVSEPWMPLTAAGAMFNKATCYRFAQDTDDAVGVFDEIVARFTSFDDLAFRRYVCMALYNKGIALKDAQRWRAAVAAFDAAISHCKEDGDTAIRERVALSLGSKVACLGELNQSAGIGNTLVELVSRFETAPEPGIQRVIGEAILVFPRLLSRLRPAAHSASLPGNLAQLDELERLKNDPEYAQAAEHYLKLQEDFVAKDVEAASRSHAQAVAVLENYWAHQKPFALFLRSFDLEASQVKVTPAQATYVPVRSIDLQYSKIEEVISGILGDRISVIGIWNPQAIDVPCVKRLIPKLELQNALWEYALHALVRLAALIVIRLDNLTAGVETELNAISQAGKEGVSIAILPNLDQADDHALVDFVTAVYNQEYSASVVERPALPPDRFAGFALAVPESELQSQAVRCGLDALIANAAGSGTAGSRPGA